LYKRGLKALFKFRKSFNLYKPKIKTLLHIFDHTVTPVLLYGSEVWGTSMVNKINKEERFLFNLSTNMKQENVHIRFLQIFSRCRQENNKYSCFRGAGTISIEVILNIFRYFRYLLKSEDVLLFEALKVSKSLKSLNINSWYGSIENLMQYINIDVEKVKNMKIDLKSLIYSKLKQKYNFVWRSEIYDDRNNKQGGNKLRTYRLFKDNISLAKYLLILNEDERRVLTKFRVSAHNLEIENEDI
jgi:hypothetical protein